ncbi:MAG: hypothetical protein C0454_02685 [Parvibaculum sp.]|nr:hypothetical protein [Parvibaculum sp.]
MTSEHDDFEPHHTSSPTDQVLTELQLYGWRPFQDEPDPRPLPEGAMVTGAIADIFDALIATLGDTRLEPDLDETLWSITNSFHRRVLRIERELDDNERGQRRLQREQDGSEVKSVELERLTAEGQTLLERRDAFELMRDQAAEHYAAHTGSHWRPRTGSMVNHANLTSALVQSRDFIAARRRADEQVLIPQGTPIAVSGSSDFNDHGLIWGVLDKVRAKYSDMVVLHGGAKAGTDLIADKWCASRKVPAVPFAPDFAKFPGRQAPFKRNDAILQVLPRGVIVFPGGGIQGNLADKARKLGIKVYDFRNQGGA